MSPVHFELVLTFILLTVSVLVTAARVLRVPYPIFLVLGGLAIGAVPGTPELELDPDLVLLIFLPPLLYGAAFFTDLHALHLNVRPVASLAVGLVGATIFAVAFVAHTGIDGLSWPEAFLLGAIVSPTDPVAATALAGRMGLPRRVVNIVEGESLVNDATGLVAYKVALGAVLTGTFSAWDAGGEFIYTAAGGLAIGLLAGWVLSAVRARLNDPPVEITISLFAGYLAYLPAEELGLSGVVAAVAVGLYMGSQTSRLTTPTLRLQIGPVWELLMFILNSVLFLLIGLQLPVMLDELREADYGQGEVMAYAAVVVATVIFVRIALSIALAPGVRRQATLVGWMGMRGAVSLAAALALPASMDNRPLIRFIVFFVILVTLVLQGLTLPAVVRALRVEPDDEEVRREESRARLHAAEAALGCLDELAAVGWAHEGAVERLRGLNEWRARRFEAQLDTGDDGHFERSDEAWRDTVAAVQSAERAALERLVREREISEDVMRRVERDLDLEAARLGIG
jgi:monovalent cation/hydrogen antiporter